MKCQCSLYCRVLFHSRALIFWHMSHYKVTTWSLWLFWSHECVLDLQCTGPVLPCVFTYQENSCTKLGSSTVFGTFRYFWVLLGTFSYFQVLPGTFCYFLVLSGTFWLVSDTFWYFLILSGTLWYFHELQTVTGYDCLLVVPIVYYR